MGEAEKEAKGGAGGEAPAAEAAPAAAPEAGGMPEGLGGTAAPQRGLFLSMKVLLVVVPLLVVLVIASVIGVYFYGRARGLTKDGSIIKANEYLGPVYPIEEIRTNIMNESVPAAKDQAPRADMQISRMLELKVNLILNSNEYIDEVNKKYPSIVDMLIKLVQGTSYEELNSVYKQNRFKRIMKDALNNILDKAKVKEVYFEKFRIAPVKPAQPVEWKE